MKRYSKANNKYMKDYDPGKSSTYIVYLDRNGLYTSILRGPLPFAEFRWLTEVKVESVKVNGVKKPIPNLYDKEKYVVHDEALRCYLQNGMVVKKIHAGFRMKSETS